MSSSRHCSQKICRLSEDRLSSLPKNCIETILICLPLKDAVRTSILSRVWRYEWTDLSQLVFDKSILCIRKYPKQVDYDVKHVKIVDQVLLFHRGPVRRFELRSYIQCSFDIDRWIYFLSRTGVKEFIYDNWKGFTIYTVPNCLFSCEEIIHLQLRQCIVKLPAWFNGFSKLTTLDFQSINIPNDELVNLIANCPLLKKLKLRNIKGCTRLKLCAPNLVDLEIDSKFEVIYFEASPLRDRESIKILSDVECQSFPDGSRCKLTNIVCGLPHIKRLALLGNSYQVISAVDVPPKLPGTCPLLHLSLDVESITNKSNNDISVEDFWGAQEDYGHLFSQLRKFNLAKYTGTTSEVKFVEFVLANAPVLEMVHIELKVKMPDPTNIYRNLIRLRRLSLTGLEILQPAKQ